MFDTDRFIIEIQSRECIWNTKRKDYTNKIVRRKAWKDIGGVFNTDWKLFSPGDQDKRIKNYIKRWKNLKDYYYKCKYKNKNGRAKTKNPSYFKSLSFLDVTKELRGRSSYVSYHESNDNNDETQMSHESDEAPSSPNPMTSPTKKSISKPCNKKKMTPFQRTLLGMVQNRNQNEEFNSNKHFLLSLLPYMDKMHDDQNLEFRVSVLNLIKHVKNDAVPRQSNNLTRYKAQNPPSRTKTVGDDKNEVQRSSNHNDDTYYDDFLLIVKDDN